MQPRHPAPTPTDKPINSSITAEPTTLATSHCAPLKRPTDTGAAAQATARASMMRNREPIAGWLKSGPTHIMATTRTLPSSAERTGNSANSSVTDHPTLRSSP